MTTLTKIDALRDRYLKMTPYLYDANVVEHFNPDEIKAIQKYGHWFNAIWEDQIPLVTDKLQHFYLAKNRLFEPRTKMESLWFKYKQLATPF